MPVSVVGNLPIRETDADLEWNYAIIDRREMPQSARIFDQ